jgi:hypothetical protein
MDLGDYLCPACDYSSPFGLDVEHHIMAEHPDEDEA